MSELTREYLDKKLDKLATKQDLKGEVANLAQNFDDKIDSLARMVADGLEEIKKELDVKKKVDSLDKRIFHIEQALNIKN